jgi:hypothetical protein
MQEVSGQFLWSLSSTSKANGQADQSVGSANVE